MISLRLFHVIGCAETCPQQVPSAYFITDAFIMLEALPPGHLEGRDSGAFGWTRRGEGQEAYPSLEVFVAEYFRVLRPEDP